MHKTWHIQTRTFFFNVSEKQHKWLLFEHKEIRVKQSDIRTQNVKPTEKENSYK